MNEHNDQPNNQRINQILNLMPEEYIDLHISNQNYIEI